MMRPAGEPLLSRPAARRAAWVAAILLPAVFLLVAWLVLRGRIRMPKIFWAWLLFIGWMLVSGTQVKDFQGAVSFGWRASMYIALATTR